jgi:hypothetical protein
VHPFVFGGISVSSGVRIFGVPMPRLLGSPASGDTGVRLNKAQIRGGKFPDFF